MSNLGDVCEEPSVFKGITNGGRGAEPQLPVAMGVWGRSPQPLGNFCKFWGKKDILIPLYHILHVVRAIWNNQIFNI